jgi:AcrR family transcriptional regulator
MVRPRFARLPTVQQQRILDAAADEFGAHGFHDASLNRIIDAVGISKGSMYYYFDGKEDLYAYVLRTEMEALIHSVADASTPPDLDADAYWANLADYYLRLMRALSASPRLAELIRGWLTAAANPSLQQAQHEMEQSFLPWLNQTLSTGQRLGAVRTDLPSELLLAVVTGMGQAMDTWLVTQPIDDQSLQKATRTFIGMIRGAVQP